MSFETFDFHINQKNLAGGFATSDEEQGADGRFRKTAWEVIHDFLYDYGIACDGVTIVGTAGFTRAKLSFRHNDGVEEIFQNHKWEIAESWRIKTLQKHLAPIMIFPTGENGIFLDFFNGAGDNPPLQKALKSLRGQKDLCFPFSPGMDFDGHPVFLDAGKNILAGGVTGSGAASLACGLIVQSVCNHPENIPTLVLIDPQGIDLPVFEKLPNVYGQKIFRDVKESEEVLDELQTEILRRKNLLEEAAVKTFTEYNQIVSQTRVRMRQIVAVVYVFNSLRELFAEKLRIRKFCEKLKKLMETAKGLGISFAFFTQRPLSEQFCSALDRGFRQTLFETKIACRTSDQVFSGQLIGRKDAEYLTGNRDLLCVAENRIQHLQQYFIGREEIGRVISVVSA